MIIRTLICLEVTLFITSALADYYDYRESSSKRFCGRSLTESLALICDGEYEAIVHNKRSGKWNKPTTKITNKSSHT